MLTLTRVFLMLLIAGAILACVTALDSPSYGVIMAGGLAALLCLTALAAPVPREIARLAQIRSSLSMRRPRQVTTPDEAHPLPAAQDTERNLVDQMLAHGRYSLLLRPEIAENLTAAQLRRAQEMLDAAMSVVPAGAVVMRSSRLEDVAEEDRHKVEKRIEVPGYYLDRFPVTNREYRKFVDAGGYEQLQLWDEDIWPAMLQFIDRTGHPGPRMWENGMYPSGKEDHPVVGVSWFEATAYARWAGKHLPGDAQWVKAAVWPVTTEGSRLMQRKFPWGDAMDRVLANLWGSGFGETVPVTKYAEGASVGGAQQMVGNVWEWTSTTFGAWESATTRLESDIPLKSLRGGAFDTYFDAQAQCQFQSGDSPLVRKHNIGFRCAVGFSDIAARREDELPIGEIEDIREPSFNPAACELHIEEEVLS